MSLTHNSLSDLFTDIADSIRDYTDIDGIKADDFPTEIKNMGSGIIDKAYLEKTITNQSIASFDNGADNIPIKNLTVDITPIQEGSGDPSPDNVRPITGHTGASIWRTGKNLADISADGLIAIRNSNISYVDGGCVVTANASYSSARFKVRTIVGRQYTFSFDAYGDGNYNRVNYTDTNNWTSSYGYTVVTLTSAHYSKTITATSDYVYIVFYPTTNQTTGSITIMNFQAEASETETAYEPYQGDIFPITFPTEAGTVYVGTLDMMTGVLTVTKVETKISNLSWTPHNSGYFINYSLRNVVKPKTNLLCSCYASCDWSVTVANMPDLAVKLGAAESAQQNIYLKDTNYNTQEALIAAVGNQSIIYELATPQTYQLTPTQITTLLGLNNIWCNTGNIKTLTYYRDPLSFFVTDTITNTAIATFNDGADNIPVKNLAIDITPVQDLHGYDYPWPAGGGKNKLPDGEQSITTSGITFTKNADGSVSLSGTASANAFYTLCNGDITLPAGNYAISGGQSLDVLVAVRNDSTTGTNIVQSIAPDEKSFELSEDTVIGAIIQVASGTTVNTTLYPMVRLRADGDATFAPYSNICPISGWTEANVWRTGKNLYNAPGPSTLAGVTLSKFDNGKFELNGTCESSVNFVRTINSITIKKGTYTISFGNESAESGQTRCDIYLVGINRTFSAASGTVSGKTTFTLDSDYTGTLSYRIQVNAGVTYTHFVIAPQLELSSTATSYEPYTGTTIPITFSTEAGTIYSGTLNVTNGVLTMDKAMVNFGSLVWTMTEITGYGYSTFNSNVSNNKAQSRNQICSAYKVIDTNRYHLSNGELGSYNDSSALKTISIRDDAFTDIDTFKSARSDVQLVYELATPLTYQLTPTQITTLLGQNNIWADCGDIISLTYRVDPSL